MSNLKDNGIPIELLEVCKKVVPKPFKYRIERYNDTGACMISIYCPIFCGDIIEKEFCRDVDSIERSALASVNHYKNYIKKLVANDFDFEKTDKEMN